MKGVRQQKSNVNTVALTLFALPLLSITYILLLLMLLVITEEEDMVAAAAAAGGRA